MIDRRRSSLNLILAASLAGSVVSMAPASAGMIGTDEVTAESRASSDRESVKALIARPEVVKQMQALGVPPEKAQARVDAMTDSEVRTLAGRLDALPAGGFSDFQWVAIVIGVLIIALLL